MRSPGRKLLLSTVLAVPLAAAGLLAFHVLDPVDYRVFVFQPVREATFFVTQLDPLADWGDIERVRVPEPEIWHIPSVGPRDVDIAAAVYRPPGVTRAPAVVILHGSYPWGRKEGLIRLLGARLSERGWMVVAPDARGFGESSDPRNADDPESWRTDKDLSRVIDFIIGTGHADPDQLFVIGHSMGANHALEGGLRDPRVKALVLIGPGRYPAAEDLTPPDWERARFAADRKLDAPISLELARFVFALGNIRLLAQSDLARPDHKPILLIDGELEGGAKLEYLRGVVDMMHGAVEYHTLPDTGHYCGVRSFYGSETIYVRPAMFEGLFNPLVEFLDRQRAASAARPTAIAP
jgi:pimeloyl-ACP methyl ester carboxylesterase